MQSSNELPLREQLIREVRGYMGTPFVHQGRLPHHGLDCIGLITVPAFNLGMEMEDYVRYSRQPNPRFLLDYISRSFDPIDAADMLPGDIMLFWMHKPTIPGHSGMLLEGGRMIHTYQNVGRVVEHNYDEHWRTHTHSTWRYKSLGNSCA